MSERDPADNEFLRDAKGGDRGIVGEFIDFMAENKAWWMAPILIVLGLVGLVLLLGATGAMPFIYSLF